MKGQDDEILCTIEKARAAGERRRRAEENLKRLGAPLLTDFTLLPELLDVFCQQTGRRELTMDDRRMFIFIVQFVYAPGNLFGYKMPRGLSKMPRGLRKATASVLGLKSESVVSDAGRLTLFNYETYPKFREEVDRIFAGMTGWIKEKL